MCQDVQTLLSVPPTERSPETLSQIISIITTIPYFDRLKSLKNSHVIKKCAKYFKYQLFHKGENVYTYGKAHPPPHTHTPFRGNPIPAGVRTIFEVINGNERGKTEMQLFE